MTLTQINLLAKSTQDIISQNENSLAGLKVFANSLVTLTSPPFQEDIKNQIQFNISKILDHVNRFMPKPTSRGLYIPPTWTTPIHSNMTGIQTIINNPKFNENIQLQLETQNKSNQKLTTQGDTRESSLKIFISHTHDDQKLAKSLIRLLRDSLDVTSEDIRCTSVAGSDLNAGDNFNEKLQRETIDSQVFIALLTHKSLESVYVTFELGARWGSKKRIFPLKVKSVPYSAIKGPLTALHVVAADERANIIKVIDDIAKELKCKIKPSSSYQDELDDFIKQASTLKKEKSPPKNETTSNVGPAISAPPVTVGPAIPPRGKGA